MKRPAFQFYPGDWLRDAALRSCSIPARGVWIDMLCIMHDGNPYGHLRVNEKDVQLEVLAKMIGIEKKALRKCVKELENHGVFSRNDLGTIYCRRMVRDESVREKRASGGVKSLENPNVPRPKDTLNGYPQGSNTAPSPATGQNEGAGEDADRPCGGAGGEAGSDLLEIEEWLTRVPKINVSHGLRLSLARWNLEKLKAAWSDVVNTPGVKSRKGLFVSRIQAA
jgi:hypothetical protein